MKILRIRRGFTTNSSGANEYLPSDAGTEDAGPSTTAGTGESTSSQGARSAPMGNAMIIGLMTAGVLLLFAAERLVRFFWTKKREKAESDEPPFGKTGLPDS
jgi:hypothetical protein